MALNHSPSIPTRGLSFAVDFDNPKSYPGTGEDLFDLSGNNNHATAPNNFTFNTEGTFSYATLTGTKYFEATNTTNIPFANSPYTILCWARINTTAVDALMSVGEDVISSLSGNAIRIGQWPYNVWFGETLTGENTGVESNQLNNIWTMYAASFDGTTIKISYSYLGEIVSASKTTSLVHNVLDTNVYLGKYGTEYAEAADISMALVYNRAISDAELKQIYDAYAWRYF